MYKIVPAALTIVALAVPAFAVTAPALGMDTVLGKTMEEVKASLSDMGYEIRKSDIEDGKMEVYFVGNGQMGEVYVSTETGKPTKINLK